MKVLSLFGGIECGLVALKRLGISENFWKYLKISGAETIY